MNPHTKQKGNLSLLALQTVLHTLPSFGLLFLLLLSLTRENDAETPNLGLCWQYSEATRCQRFTENKM